MQKKLNIGWFSFSCCEDSITGNNKLYAKINGKLFFGTVEELEQKFIPLKIKNINGKQLIEPRGKLEILSVVGNTKKESKVIWKQTKYLIKHFVRKDIFNIMLRTGQSIVTTGDHSLFKRIITNKYIGNYHSEPIEKIVPCKISNLNKKDSLWCVHDYGFDTKDYDIDDDLLILIGLWIADGCYDYQHGLHISTGNDPDIIIFLRKIGKKFKFNLTIRENGDTTLNSRSFMRKFINEFKLEHYAKNKRIPNWCFLLSERQIRLLFRGYFSGDGTIDKNGVSCSSINLELIKDLKELLQRLGITSSISMTKKRNNVFGTKKYRGNISYRLHITKVDSVNRFLYIGFIQEYKMKKLKRTKYFRNKFYGLIAHRIRSIEVIPVEEYVYDFDVPGTQNFIANGVLCHNSTILFTELLNDHYKEWLKLINFQHVRILKKENKLEGLDVAFVEGAIASPKQEKRVKEIRANCKKLITIGSCAMLGMPSSQRNTFDKKRKEEIEFLITRFKLLDKVVPVKEVVKVDAEVPGCPMDTNVFLKVLNKTLKEFKIKNA